MGETVTAKAGSLSIWEVYGDACHISPNIIFILIFLFLMKTTLTIDQIAFLKAIAENTPRTKTEIAKIIFGVINDALWEAEKARKDLIKSYEEEIQEEDKDVKVAEGEARPTKTVTRVPQDKIPELNERLRVQEYDFEISAMAFLPLNQAVRNFPEVINDKDGNRGLRGERDIMAYEELKEKFCK